MTEREQMNDEIRQILDENARLAVTGESLSESTDLFDAGMTSHATVNVLLAVEEKYEIEFPTEMLRRSTFATIADIRDSVILLASPSLTA